MDAHDIIHVVREGAVLYDNGTKLLQITKAGDCTTGVLPMEEKRWNWGSAGYACVYLDI